MWFVTLVCARSIVAVLARRGANAERASETLGHILENRLQQEEERQWRTRRFCYLDDICTTLPLSEKEARPHGKCKGMGLTLDIWMMWALVLGSVPCDVEGWYCTVRLQPNYVAYWLENLVYLYCRPE